MCQRATEWNSEGTSEEGKWRKGDVRRSVGDGMSEER